ncbi:hypothetical protein ACHAPT_001129 [Fusarium lateritium]
MAPLISPRDLGLAKILARASATLSPPTLVVRQNAPTATVTVVPDDDNGNDSQTLSGGAIAGIVIGSIVGFLLLLWVIRSCLNLGAPPQEREKWYHYKEDSPRRHRHRSRSTRRRSSISVPPSVVIRDSRPRSYRRSVSPSHYYSDSERGRGSRYYV